MKKLNCWEFKNCGRQPGGFRENEFGTCPAATAEDFNGVNSGLNAGRYCWAVSGTYCNGTVSGTFAVKTESCIQCEFLQTIMDEEGVKFKLQLHPLKKPSQED